MNFQRPAVAYFERKRCKLLKIWRNKQRSENELVPGHGTLSSPPGGAGRGGVGQNARERYTSQLISYSSQLHLPGNELRSVDVVWRLQPPLDQVPRVRQIHARACVASGSDMSTWVHPPGSRPPRSLQEFGAALVEPRLVVNTCPLDWPNRLSTLIHATGLTKWIPGIWPIVTDKPGRANRHHAPVLTLPMGWGPAAKAAPALVIVAAAVAAAAAPAAPAPVRTVVTCVAAVRPGRAAAAGHPAARAGGRRAAHGGMCHAQAQNVVPIAHTRADADALWRDEGEGQGTTDSSEGIAGRGAASKSRRRQGTCAPRLARGYFDALGEGGCPYKALNFGARGTQFSSFPGGSRQNFGDCRGVRT
eukprot:gene10099-biopygen1735